MSERSQFINSYTKLFDTFVNVREALTRLDTHLIQSSRMCINAAYFELSNKSKYLEEAKLIIKTRIPDAVIKLVEVEEKVYKACKSCGHIPKEIGGRITLCNCANKE